MSQPKVVEIELGYEERKRHNRFRQSTLSEHLRINQHPLADSPTIKSSLIDWIATFKNLPRFPGNIRDFITSGTLYFIMEEIDPQYFQEFSYKDLNKQEARQEQEVKTLKKVYKHMLTQMELWFSAHQEAMNSMRSFKHDIIDLNKLIVQQDINELLVLIEFILCIILKCENYEQLIQQFVQLEQDGATEQAAADMRELIEGANIQMSEMPQSEVDPRPSFMDNQSFKMDLYQQL